MPSSGTIQLDDEHHCGVARGPPWHTDLEVEYVVTHVAASYMPSPGTRQLDDEHRCGVARGPPWQTGLEVEYVATLGTPQHKEPLMTMHKTAAPIHRR
jgi:hypothetical protein